MAHPESQSPRVREARVFIINDLQIYIPEVTQIYQTQNATEHTYLPAFKKLMESLNLPVEAINEPKRIPCDAPDFMVKNAILEKIKLDKQGIQEVDQFCQ